MASCVILAKKPRRSREKPRRSREKPRRSREKPRRSREGGNLVDVIAKPKIIRVTHID